MLKQQIAAPVPTVTRASIEPAQEELAVFERLTMERAVNRWSICFGAETALKQYEHERFVACALRLWEKEQKTVWWRPEGRWISILIFLGLMSLFFLNIRLLHPILIAVVFHGGIYFLAWLETYIVGRIGRFVQLFQVLPDVRFVPPLLKILDTLPLWTYGTRQIDMIKPLLIQLLPLLHRADVPSLTPKLLRILEGLLHKENHRYAPYRENLSQATADLLATVLNALEMEAQRNPIIAENRALLHTVTGIRYKFSQGLQKNDHWRRQVFTAAEDYLVQTKHLHIRQRK